MYTVTLREKMMNDNRTKTIRLICVDGRFIEEGGEKDCIIEKYGNRNYCNGYSEGDGKVDIWVI